MSADTDMVSLKACPLCSNGFHAPPDTRAALDASGIGEMVAENRELRNIIASLGYCAPEASLEFMRLIPGEVALSRARATQSGEG